MPVYDRHRLQTAAAVVGSAIIKEEECTTIVGPDATATVDAVGNLVVGWAR